MSFRTGNAFEFRAQYYANQSNVNSYQYLRVLCRSGKICLKIKMHGQGILCFLVNF